MVFPVIAVILVLSLVGFLRKVFIFGFLVRHSVGYQGAMIFSIIAFLAVFIATLRHQKKIIVRLWCRRCPGLEKKPVSDGFMLII
ncbi:MAG: hypothetical protein A2420_03880 [Candidatus Moranbacteria bacterium RIFOXYC1_FULL_44_13]|nr:MAG: hypothetical protein A2184_02265 [Candidatus Moranbacteria bacterium RIFOXYA1_FULL_44_7]OGI32476.1 MAG: hypothetical protein A2420_03880 [Candidatus Moranbacteria bacterium RIFOXYC1_FULL_44_13]OGI37632.1 MAG: hypothetical protein A2612_04380 [Candidatus Moranbacteria bacterium RIFOXYD1_FULL_44_12]